MRRQVVGHSESTDNRIRRRQRQGARQVFQVIESFNLIVEVAGALVLLGVALLIGGAIGCWQVATASRFHGKDDLLGQPCRLVGAWSWPEWPPCVGSSAATAGSAVTFRLGQLPGFEDRLKVAFASFGQAFTGIGLVIK